MKKSAGILVYKIKNKEIQILLCHLGGPYFRNIDEGAWSISKGEKNKEEKILQTAIREFKEETNLDVTNNVNYLISKKISKKKLVVMFYLKKDYDIKKCKSNYFKIEYPRKSGNIKTFPEMSKYEWMSIKDAKKKIIKNQLFFINKLEEKLEGGINE